MLIASKGGDITAARLLGQIPESWLFEVEGKEVRLSKDDDRRQAFEKMSDALTFARADEALIQYFAELEAVESAGLGYAR